MIRETTDFYKQNVNLQNIINSVLSPYLCDSFICQGSSGLFFNTVFFFFFDTVVCLARSMTAVHQCQGHKA